MNQTAIDLTDGDRELFDREFEHWLPECVLDTHVHVFSKAAFPAGFAFAADSCYTRFGGEFRLEQCLQAASVLMPGRRFGMLSFGTPHAALDRDAAARYTGSISDNRERFGLLLVSPGDPVAAVEKRVRRDRLVGYKPYHSYVQGVPTDAVRIPQMLSVAQMDLANALGLAIMLHIPRRGRLADPLNQADMVDLCRRWPRAQIIFAHIGRAYWYANVVGNLAALAECPNAWLDTAMVNHEAVLEYAFTHFPKERILFGSDAPIACLRGKSVEINDQYAYLMGEPYRIGTTLHDPRATVRFTFFHYEMLRAVKGAAARAGWNREDLDGFFHGNARRLLAGIAGRLGHTGSGTP